MLEAVNISKEFPGVKVLNQVNFKFYPAQVNAILGENGAGKSTLLKILTGEYTEYEGEIKLNGKTVRFSSIKEAQNAGIAIIHQELNPKFIFRKRNQNCFRTFGYPKNGSRSPNYFR